MTDEITNETAAPVFDAVPVEDLPITTIGATPETIALGKALLSVVNDATAARDSVVSSDRAGALNRGAILKRAVAAAGGAPKGRRLSIRVLAVEGGYQVHVLLAKSK